MSRCGWTPEARTAARAIVRAGPLVVAALLSATCDGSTGPALNLGLNREKWLQRGPADYAFDFHRSCFCLDTATLPVRITVRQGAVTGVVWIPGGEPVDAANVARFFNLTLDSLFGVVERAIAVGADRLSVDYDREYGYPAQVTIDYDTRTADEELALDARLVTAAAQHGIGRNTAATLAR